MPFAVGDRVRWQQQRALMGGSVVAIVPVGALPAAVGFPRADGGGFARDAESYVVRARRITPDGRPYSAYGDYWPEAVVLQGEVS